MRHVKAIHLVGIGGIGMCGIAELLLNQGFRVSGSDLRSGDITRRLAGLGARVAEGHAASNLDTPDVVVVSSAVGPENPEVVEARRRGIPVIPRAEMLAELMRLKTGVAVAGSHGKTTTTSLLAAVLSEAGFDPTYVIGGRLKSTASGARLGAGEILLAEADESDGSFLLLAPHVVVVTNIDREHMDHYADMEALQQAFLAFVNRIPFFGCAVLNVDDVSVRRLIDRVHRPRITYGLAHPADYLARNIRIDGMRMAFDLDARGKDRGTVRVKLLGRHNVSNSLAVIAAADELGVPDEATRRALESFTGVGRRLEFHRRDERFAVIDDYGHHPTEIRATLTSLKAICGGRLVVVFQPHRYSRTWDLLREFQSAFDAADQLVLLDIYGAGESNPHGVSARDLAQAVIGAGGAPTVHLEGSAPLKETPVFESVLERVEALVRPGDWIVTLGAGDVTRLAPELARRLDG